MNPRSRKAFTLLEIMIVVAVIGFLSLLAIPNITRARQKTRRGLCVNNQRLIYDGMVQFYLVAGEQFQGDDITPEKALQMMYVAGYIKGDYPECPTEGLVDQDDYKMVVNFQDGMVWQGNEAFAEDNSGPPGGGVPQSVWIECRVKPEEHTDKGI